MYADGDRLRRAGSLSGEVGARGLSVSTSRVERPSFPAFELLETSNEISSIDAEGQSKPGDVLHREISFLGLAAADVGAADPKELPAQTVMTI